METIEEIILRHSARGMTRLLPDLPVDFCARAAAEIVSWNRGVVLLLTGFSVNGAPETDGPTGTYVMAKALSSMGFRPIVVSEEETCKLFSAKGIQPQVVDCSDDTLYMDVLLSRLNPQGIISIERCGRNARGLYCNMRGVDISDRTAPVDELVIKARHYQIPTVGVGDGGNEIGMGNVASAISKKLAIEPCDVPVGQLVIATVSNWGAYGIVRALEKGTAKTLLPDFSEIRAFYEYIASCGCVDGVTGLCAASVDGFSLEVEEEVVEALRRA